MITDKFFNSLLEKFEQYIEAQSEELEQTKKAEIIKLIEERPVFEGMTKEQAVTLVEWVNEVTGAKTTQT
jgi:hypothetical protein